LGQGGEGGGGGGEGEGLLDTRKVAGLLDAYKLMVVGLGCWILLTYIIIIIILIN
jgi:hypothetical protein